MYERVKKPKDYKSRAVANSVGQRKSNGVRCFLFVDNRHKSIAQRKLQQMTNNKNICKVVQKVRSYQKQTRKNQRIHKGSGRSETNVLVDLTNEAISYSSDEDDSDRRIFQSSMNRVDASKKGRIRQSLRSTEILKLRHHRGGVAVGRAAIVAVGPSSAQQGTFGMVTTSDGTIRYASSSSSTPFANFAQMYSTKDPLVTRGQYKDRSHVHLEPAIIRDTKRQGQVPKHISVNKPICPVCAAVMRAFDVSFNESNVRKNYPDTWNNPFDKQSEPNDWKIAADAAKKACSNALTQLINCD
jgi:hypothetical protein